MKMRIVVCDKHMRVSAFLFRASMLVAAIVLFIAGLCHVALQRLESNRRNPVQEEIQIAKSVHALGGTYAVHSRHIVAVFLNDTAAADQDVELIVRLPYLRTLELNNTHVTRHSLDAILAHPRLTNVSANGTDITTSNLKNVFMKGKYPEKPLYFDLPE